MSDKAQILIVDDEPDLCELLQLTLERMDHACHVALNLKDARALLRKRSFDLCLTDMRLPDGDGIDLVRGIQEHWPELPVAVITAHGNMDTAIEALKAGAFDFLSKPLDLTGLRQLVKHVLELRSHTERRTRERLLGESEPMREIRAMVAKLARSQAPVYITGQSGTGKELVARMIHELGARADQPFVPVNCGAIPSELMESEFFGHRKGSFTGAVADKPGLFLAADGGTLFLDEIAELPLAMQVKLLRAIQEKAVRPVGADREVHTDVRVLSATHKDLGALVQTGEFREDLYYRINVISLRVPSLAERREDLDLLADYFLGHLNRDNQRHVRLGAAALDALRAYDFPGNVRELENILERASTLCEGGVITPADLVLPEIGSVAAGPSDADLEGRLEDYERDAIRKALEETRFNKTAAARKLGITFRALRYRLKKLGMEED
ncbi:MAG: sigma-54 dependent transcriptional regulator [Gammaproteobacteria bacterium]|nr:sigma-54 dependent transcriptional regulator [Gammaproteobacteria bacterium]